MEHPQNPTPTPQISSPQPHAAATTRTLQVQFTGKAGEYFKIWIVNVFLTVITLGIYSAWAKVRNTQYFYGNTTIDGSSFQYTAKPLQILKGRLIAFACLLAFSLVGELSPALGAPLGVLFLGLIPWVLVRSLTFNARNTLYRNVRFNFVGKTRSAAFELLLMPLASMFTLGLLLPYVLWRQLRFVLSNSRYGTSAFEFTAGARTCYFIFLKMLLLVLLAVACLLGTIAFGVVSALGGEDMTVLLLLLVVVTVLSIIAAVGYQITALYNLRFNHTRLDGVQLSMNLKAMRTIWIYLTNTVLILASFGLMVPWAKVRMALYRASCAQVHVTGSLDAFVSGQQEKVSALGDQLGDVFDLDFSIV
ncbi:MAG: DUF898 domain-containing protein [Limnobacter sp.]|nr:DUF898 domain-containing protein [Limnobacter sp.]